MRQPDKTLAPLVAPILEGYKKEYDLGLSFKKMRDGGFDEIVFNSNSWPAGSVKPYGYHDVKLLLALRCDAVTELILAMEVSDRENFKVVRGVPGNAVTIVRTIDFHPFDPDRDKLYIIRHDRLEADCVAVAARFRDMMEKDGFAWFERYSDPLNLSRDINESVSRDVMMAGAPFAESQVGDGVTGLAAACVAEPQRVSELHDLWLERYRLEDEYQSARRSRYKPTFSTIVRRFDYIIDEARKAGYEV